MYLTDEAITINWEISLTVIDAVVPRSYFDILLTLPDGTSTYLTDPTTGYVAPVYTLTVNTLGNVTYTFTPVTPGLHKVELVAGTSSDYEVLSTHQIYAVCPPALQVARTEAFAKNNIVVKEFCITPLHLSNVEWGRSNISWHTIQGMGRHADAGKIVIAGSFSGPINNVGYRDIGVMDTATGVITNMVGALTSCGGSTAFSVGGIDCNRDTGVYVVTGTGSGNAAYPAWYSTDLTTWTQATHPANPSAGLGPVHYDPQHELWYWQVANTKLFVSADDGVNWSTQNVYYEGFSNSPMTRALGFTHSELDPFEQGGIFLAGDTGRAVRSKPVPGVAPIYTTTSTPPGGLQEVMHYNSPLFAARPAMVDVAYNYDTVGVHMLATSGEIASSNDIATFGDVWEASARLVTAPNELTDEASTWTQFYRVNGSYFATKVSFDGWWKLTTDENPAGTGWAIDATGDIWSWSGTAFQVSNRARINTADEVFCVANWTTNNREQYVYFDVST